MSVLLATGTFTLLEAPSDSWGSSAADDEFVAVGTVKGTLSGAQGGQDGAGNVVYVHKLILDPCALTEAMRVRDETTGLEYAVIDAPRRATLVPATTCLVTRATAST